MGFFLRSRLKPFTVETTMRFRPPAQLVRLREGAAQLAAPDVMAVILRAAAAETLVLAYRRRFLAAMPGMVNMQRDKKRERADPRVGSALKASVSDAYASVVEATQSGDQAGLRIARERLVGLQQRLHDRLEIASRAKKGRFPTGRFRNLAFRVLEEMSHVQVSLQPSGTPTLVAGIGLRADLDRIKTPSATPDLTGHPTRSTRNILWRQLEFGTGAYSTRKRSQASRYRLASGGWWYGHSPENSLHLRGTKPGGMLRDPERQLPYDADSVRFYSVFARLLGAALGG